MTGILFESKFSLPSSPPFQPMSLVMRGPHHTSSASTIKLQMALVLRKTNSHNWMRSVSTMRQSCEKRVVKLPSVGDRPVSAPHQHILEPAFEHHIPLENDKSNLKTPRLEKRLARCTRDHWKDWQTHVHLPVFVLPILPPIPFPLIDSQTSQTNMCTKALRTRRQRCWPRLHGSHFLGQIPRI